MNAYLERHKTKTDIVFHYFCDQIKPSCRNRHDGPSYLMTVMRQDIFEASEIRHVSTEEVEGLIISEGRGSSNPFVIDDQIFFWCKFKGLYFEMNWNAPSNADDIKSIRGDFIRGIKHFLEKYDAEYAVDMCWVS